MIPLYCCTVTRATFVELIKCLFYANFQLRCCYNGGVKPTLKAGFWIYLVNITL